MNIHSYFDLIMNPSKLYRTLLQRKYPGGILNDRTAISLLYQQRFGKKPNLNNPTSFNEKLLWLTLNDRRPVYTTMVDKYKAKEYIASVVGEQYVIKNLGCWRNINEINYSQLPSKYVLKCNHDSGSVVICNNTKPQQAELQKLDKAQKRNYFWFSREWAYKNVTPVIFAEEYIECLNEEEGIIDYKFYCFNGVPKYILVISHRASGGKETFFDIEWNVLNVSKGYPRHEIPPVKPHNIEEMLVVANKLSNGFPFLRVDLFVDQEGRTKVGELTLTPSSGMIKFSPDEYDELFGENLILPDKIVLK